MNMQDFLTDQRARCLPAPEGRLDERKVSAFEAVYQSALRGQGRAPVVNYDCEYPKHEFLDYLVERRGLLLHGSNEKNINFLVPLRRSADSRGVGNLPAVYACSDGIWPIFFAIWERRRYGATVNFCFRGRDEDGRPRKFYGFSIAAEGGGPAERDAAGAGCWTDGMVYVVPRDSFTQLVDAAGNLLEEWASTEPVPVFTKLPVSLQDFPFLKDVVIGGGPPPPAPRPRAAIDPQVYEAYVGRYVVSPDLILNLERKDDRLFVRATGFPTVEMHPESETVYTLQEINAQIVFVRDDGGEVTRLLLQVEGRGLSARKV